MELKDLRSGMIVELRNGEREIVILNYCGKGRDVLAGLQNNDKFVNLWTDLAHYDFNLLHDYSSELDIVRVYSSCVYALNELDELLWEREEAETTSKQIVDMTMEEVCKALGKKIRIVDGK